ncbi:zinc finger protein 638-like [Etheostoma cragini]|uniref:zinc finger protein 638-like n=1 Tax=Etheostoma cragini TaxID=417921 RepID=UPI00155E16C4|nr:zinc finger protein 638-like [Etheostoma cragini]
MYHHHHQQQGPQHFSNGSRPPHQQPSPNQHQTRSPSNVLSQAMGFQFPRPTQLPDELESALAIRGARDMDHRLIDHTNRPNQHQNQGPGSGISQHGNYDSKSITPTSDNQPGHQQGVDWSNYQPPAKLFANPLPSASHKSQQQQPQSSHAGTSIQNWTSPGGDSATLQSRHHCGGGDGQALYTPESAGSILASFGLSNEDLEVLSHYPDDQLTPDTLPFILRDIQINKSGNQKSVASSLSFSRSHDISLPPSRSSPLARSSSPEVPSLLTVTQTAGKVIDYGHASRAKDESGTRETFKREPLSSERTVKMYPSSSSSSAPKIDKVERRQIRLENSESSKHGDQDYRRTSSDHHKSSRSPGREFPSSSKSRNLDRDYRREGPVPRPSSETKNEASLRRSLSSSSCSKPRSSKKLPNPTMISDFSAVSPKVYPHTCSLCHTQCDQEKDWVDHINTVNHTAACRDLRNKYPDWKPNLSSRSGRYGSRALWDPKDHSPSHSASRSLSCSPTPSPPHGKHRVGHPHPHPYRLSTRPYSSHHQPRHQHYTGGSSRSGVKRQYDSTKFSTDIRRHPSSSKPDHTFKHGPLQSKMVKSGKKPGTKTTKIGIAKAADRSAKLPPAKKKKKVMTPAFQDLSVADRLVYLTGIPKDASEQEVTDLVGSFGKINNVILMPCSEEESENCEGQKASVCLVKAEDAQALANCPNLSIRDQQITAIKAKKVDAGQSSDFNNRNPSSRQDNGATVEDPAGGDADQKTYNEKGLVLISDCPESDWSENDIINLVKPFGTPSDIIQAPQIGKVLVSVPDIDIAQEMVKIYNFTPAKINNRELKMIHLKQRISLSTPVALYNLLMGSVDPLESPGPVGWNCLLVISNVPNTPTGASEVQKLVRRFGTVIKTVVLNNMVICEMATAAMALSVYKRFQMFPCIIQNNPLFFSRKPDPKANTQIKVTTYPDSPEDTPMNGKGSQAATAAASADKENLESPLEAIEKACDRKDEKTNTDKTVGEGKDLEEDWSKDDKIRKDKLVVDLSLAAPHAKPGADSETDMRDKPAVKTVVETAEENICVNAPTKGNDKTPAGEETKPSSSDGQAAIQELPKVTQEMVKALLVECRTRTASNPNNTATSTNEEQGGTQMETKQGEKTTEGIKEPAKNHTEEVKKQEMERKEREARKERERRVWEKEERNRRQRERDERARREREKREEDRRQRKRKHRESFSGSRLSCRSDEYTQSSWMDELYNNSEVEEEEFDDFPFNMSDFVTVDEVGDVTDLPCSSPSPSVPMETTDGGEDAPTSFQQDAPGDTPMEVTPESTMSDAPATLVKSEHVPESEPVAVQIAETSDGLVSSDLKPRLVLIAATSPSPASQADSSPSQTHVPTCQTEAPRVPLQTDIKTETQIPPQTEIKTETQIPPLTEIKTETQINAQTKIPPQTDIETENQIHAQTKITPQTDIETDTEATLDSTTEVEPLFEPAPAASAHPADSSSNSPTTGVVTSENERENDALNYSQVKKEEMVSDKTEENEKVQDEEDKETGALAGGTVKREKSEDQTNTEEESVKMTLKRDTPMSTDYSLPPFDPSSPVGIEFLVPKTGFFCKVCNRFFSGTKEAEINHCKTLKHYENLQKYLQTTKTVNLTVKPESI